MKILLLEPFLTGSHRRWAEELKKFSRHDIHISGMSGHHWKWRMHGGAVTLARKFNESDYTPDLILATDMIDLTTFSALTAKKTFGIPKMVYFHENQLTYPWNYTDKDVRLKRDHHYGFINFSTAVCADKIFFNSQHHLESFTRELPAFLNSFPDHNETGLVEQISQKSRVLYPGMNLEHADHTRKQNQVPVFLWNHRWEHDKNPDSFFEILFKLKKEGFEFELIVLGESYENAPQIFKSVSSMLGDKILHWGYVDSYEKYLRLLLSADILPVTSNHDFFGMSVIEAINAGCYPLLPDRLAYPEHIPENLREKYLYADEAELLEKLKHILRNFPFDGDAGLIQHVKRYDWKNIIDQYDQAFEEFR
ncbi:MAG: glycosyl transferase family 1 [Bacteroidetes bacterium GWF2_38_335]|nr:MAG: glycosyl transferase family 1 [Bacteroidetes bacterium GWF2_38_335]OFY78192.1 MAG: glycosyl transferase family 1 [Bacteroidetes bacterium RIFOXYA12_FULL_38_20]HBS88645.1 DUF3524 domain-containing protein [Bacteroidales bacterium]